MVNVRIMSDLHLEFPDVDEQRAFISMLDPENVDVLVLAGDICTHRLMVDMVSSICQRFENSTVIWVHGNHEYYGTGRETIVARSMELMKQNKNLKWLELGSVELGGIKFLGTTMWFPYDPGNDYYEYYMNDFRVIRGFKGWVYEQNVKARSFLEQELTPNSVVITHHLPSMQSVAIRYRLEKLSRELNRFYVSDMEKLIQLKGPLLWIHGHTHDSFDYTIDHVGNTTASTRVVCNPRGYIPDGLNPDFNIGLTIEL